MQETYKQENNFQIGNNKDNNTKKILSISFQIFLWFFIIFSIFNNGTFPIFVVIYFLYLIIEFHYFVNTAYNKTNSENKAADVIESREFISEQQYKHHQQYLCNQIVFHDSIIAHHG